MSVAMAKIAVLSEHLVNKIAAGEVVERPASVVKELMENSLDAGAGRIAVEVEDGGKRLIQVSDDGGGMSGEDLALAYRPHATSKISSDEDLFAIGTLGFRGEALASIASVSQVEVVTRAAEEIEGVRLAIAGGRAEPIEPTAAAVGTVTAVRNLFFNTPARRKFLRTTNTEMGHITEQFTRIALAHSEVQLRLAHNGRVIHDLPAGQSLVERIGALFSGEMADGLLAIEREGKGIKISGSIAAPQHSRAGTQWQYVLVNGRYIRDRFVSHAIREGYRGLLEQGKQPVVFLFIRVPADKVDVNVHPAKTEVRFVDSNLVHSMVLAAIRDRLLSTDLSASMRDSQLAKGTQDSIGTGGEGKRQGESEEERRERVRQAMADFFKKAPPPTTGVGESGGGYSRPESGAGQRSSAGDYHHQQDREFRPTAGAPRQRETAAERSEWVSDGDSDRHETVEQGGRDGKYLQMHNSYLVMQSEEGMVIIDQHALHERIIVEQLYRQFREGEVAAQRCLIPETIEVTAEQMAAAENSSELLAKLGIIVEAFGPRSLAVQGYPAVLKNVAPGDFVADVIDTLGEQSGRLDSEELLGKVLETMACKAAVKAGDALSDAEIESLLAEREAVERSSNCPHGRPTSIRLSLSQLAKEFKRT